MYQLDKNLRSEIIATRTINKIIERKILKFQKRFKNVNLNFHSESFVLGA